MEDVLKSVEITNPLAKKVLGFFWNKFVYLCYATYYFFLGMFIYILVGLKNLLIKVVSFFIVLYLGLNVMFYFHFKDDPTYVGSWLYQTLKFIFG